MIIDVDDLRKDLLNDSYGAAFGGGFGGAFREAIDIERASDEEVVKIAVKKGIGLSKYEVKYEVFGLDADDGRWDRDNYDPKLLAELLEQIADCYECSVEEITDEMFCDYVTPDEPDDTTQWANFTYYKSTGKSRYYYTNSMHEIIKETEV